jgi:16S rRNA (cytosine1402-N4)-methyltransferase
VSQSKPHISVMASEVISLLKPQEGKTYLDATFGAGGHTRGILNASESCKVIGLDRDITVMPFAEEIAVQFPNRFTFINGKFSEIGDIVNCEIDGALFDIGVSSMQINEGERGFSFMKDGPLEMTMGRNNISAYHLVNKYREEDIAEIIFKYGEEKYGRKIAEAICSFRKKNPIETTLQLAKIVESVIPRRGKIHPATLTFQAIRVFVNDELTELKAGLQSIIEKITVNGAVVVITFQGLEDRIVKDIFKRYTHREHENKFKKAAVLNEKLFHNLVKGVLKPSRQEVRSNTRARSAKIRAIYRSQ